MSHVHHAIPNRGIRYMYCIFLRDIFDLIPAVPTYSPSAHLECHGIRSQESVYCKWPRKEILFNNLNTQVVDHRPGSDIQMLRYFAHLQPGSVSSKTQSMP